MYTSINQSIDRSINLSHGCNRATHLLSVRRLRCFATRLATSYGSVAAARLEMNNSAQHSSCCVVHRLVVKHSRGELSCSDPAGSGNKDNSGRYAAISRICARHRLSSLRRVAPSLGFCAHINTTQYFFRDFFCAQLYYRTIL